MKDNHHGTAGVGISHFSSPFLFFLILVVVCFLSFWALSQFCILIWILRPCLRGFNNEEAGG